MKTPTVAILAASLLAVAEPVLADRYHPTTGSALKDAYRKEYRHQQNNQDERRADRHRARGSEKQGSRKDRKHRAKHRRGKEHHYREETVRHTHKRRPYRKRHYKKRYRDHYPARPYYAKRHFRRGHYRWRPAHFHYGYHWSQLPRSFVAVRRGGLRFFYSDGIFYRPRNYGYVVVEPPIGAIVHSLPGTAISLAFGGHHYYVAYDTYYIWDPSARAYRVVADPGFQY
ncbi:DUF6515 family protein [Microbulbifer sp. 2201CG32-9]|uniref:DUF6515 family protein n=1 Tax=Microbulbifer sp. 2201CG32-9 TaxID=3232309 RepID=UPI00345BB74F